MSTPVAVRLGVNGVEYALEVEPLTRGTRAAAPHTDKLLAGNSPASLEELASMLKEI